MEITDNTPRMSIGKRVTIAFASLLALQLGLAAVTLYHSENIELDQQKVFDSLETYDAIALVRDAIRNLAAAERGYLLTGESKYFGEFEDAQKSFNAGMQFLTYRTQNSRELTRAAMDIQKFVEPNAAKARRLMESRRQHRTRDSVHNGVLANMNPAFDKLDQIRHAKEDQHGQANYTGGVRSRIFRLVVISSSCAAILYVLFVIFSLTRALVFPLRQLLNRVRNLRDGAKFGPYQPYPCRELNELQIALRELLTQRRDAEDTVRTQTKQFQTLLNSCPLPIVGVTDQLIVTLWNPAAEKLFGWSESEVLGQPLPTIPEDQKAPSYEILERIRKGSLLTSYEAIRVRRDGSRVTLNVACAPITKNGEFLGGVAIVQDISEQKRQDEEKAKLIQSQQALNSLFEQVAYASAFISDMAVSHHHDLSSILKTIAKQARMITGSDFGAIGIVTSPDKPFDPFVSSGHGKVQPPPPPVSGVLGWVARHGQTLRLSDITQSPAFSGKCFGDETVEGFLGVPIRYEGRSIGNLYLAKRPGGQAFTQNDQRAIELLATHCGIVIQNSRLYDGILRGRKKLELIADCSSAMVNSLDGCLIMKRTAEKLTEAFSLACAFDIDVNGVFRRECISKASPDIFDFGFLQGQTADHPFARAIRTREAVSFQVNRRRMDRWFFDAHQADIQEYHHGIVVPINVQGKIFGTMTVIFGAGSDTSEDQSVTEEIARRISLTLENVRLYQESQRALQLREDTVAIVSHDLKGPLSAIGIAAELLRRATKTVSESGLPERGFDIERRLVSPIQNIQRALGQGQRLIHNLLDYARIESGNLVLDIKPASVSHAVRDTVTILAPIGRKNGLELNLSMVDELPPLPCDIIRVQQVLSNLIENAIKFSGPGGRVTVDVSEPNPLEVQFSVRDDGPGIPLEQLASIFDRYYQAPSTQRQGAGLGLYIAKGIVDAHRGRIWVESTVGKGTCFYFTLPRPAESALQFPSELTKSPRISILPSTNTH